MNCQEKISEDQFWNDVELCKQIIDNGAKHWFVLMNCSSFLNLELIGNTTIKDIEEVFGEKYLSALTFGETFRSRSNPNEFFSMLYFLRKLRESDKKRLRCDYKYFPKDTYILSLVPCESGLTYEFPFTIDENSQVKFLADSAITAKKHINYKSDYCDDYRKIAKRTIELLPDYYCSLLAVSEYKGIEFAIPIENHSAKYTFKNRDKDGDRKKPLIHDVRTFRRKNLVTVDNVREHLRGRSDFDINGIHIKLFSSVDWGERLLIPSVKHQYAHKKRKNSKKNYALTNA